ncbi:MAG: hypothetical protein QOH91_439, partial [Mycobacterium sp.]|nr:hypothetical protein [Mycobacterium sp.]
MFLIIPRPPIPPRPPPLKGGAAGVRQPVPSRWRSRDANRHKENQQHQSSGRPTNPYPEAGTSSSPAQPEKEATSQAESFQEFAKVSLSAVPESLSINPLGRHSAPNERDITYDTYDGLRGGHAGSFAGDGPDAHSVHTGAAQTPSKQPRGPLPARYPGTSNEHLPSNRASARASIGRRRSGEQVRRRRMAELAPPAEA